MIDLPPEKVIEQRLVKCGLNPLGVSVIYEDYLQSIEVAIKPEAEVTSDQFGCIREAVASEVVTFSDPDMNRRYNDFVAKLLRPQMLDDARHSLEKIGRLANFPVRGAYGSDKLFAEAIEVHCGVPKGRALKEFGNSIVFMPPQEDYRDTNKFSKIYGCLFEAIIYVAATLELTVGLIGNEEIRHGKSK